MNSITDPIREHCPGTPSVLLVNALTKPMIVIVRCHGCGKEISVRGFENHVNGLVDIAVDLWEKTCEEGENAAD